MIPFKIKEGLKFVLMNFIGHMPIQTLRHSFYRRCLKMKIGRKSIIYGRAEIRAGANITIGNCTSIGHDVVLDGRRGIMIGDSVNFSSGVWVWTMQHDVDDPDFKGVGGPVRIDDFAWLGGRVIVLPNVHIGEGAVVASGAVVTKDVEPYTVVAGIPARKIKDRARGLRYKLGAFMWFA